MHYHRPDAFKRVHAVPHAAPLVAADFRREGQGGALSKQDLRRIVAAMVD